MPGRLKSKDFLEDAVLILLIAANLFMLNLLLMNRSARIDLTEDKRFTITKFSKDSVKNLEDVLKITFYVADEPENYYMIRQVNDIVGEYMGDAGGKLKYKVEKLPLEVPREKAEELSELEIEGEEDLSTFLQGGKKEKKAAEKTKGKSGTTVTRRRYRDVLVQYLDQKVVIPDVSDNVAEFEYALTSAIKQVTTQTRTTIGFLQGHGEPDFYNDQQIVPLKRAIEDKYLAEPVNLNETDGVPDYISTLVIIGAKDIPPVQLYEIDQYLMKGGSLFILDNMVELQPLNFVSSGLAPMLEHYGLREHRTIVYDRKCRIEEFTKGVLTKQKDKVPVYFVIEVDPNNVGKGIIGARALENKIVVPYTMYLEIVKENLKKGTKAYKVFTSSDNSYILQSDKAKQLGDDMAEFNKLNQEYQQLAQMAQRNGIQNMPQDIFQMEARLQQLGQSITQDLQEIPGFIHMVTNKMPTMDDLYSVNLEEKEEKLLLSAMVTGNFDSYVPPDYDPPEERIKSSKKPGAVFVVPTKYVLLSPSNAGNMEFLVNMLDQLTIGTDLVDIRSRRIMNRRIPSGIGEAVRARYKYFNLLFVPLLVIIVGGVRLSARIRRRSRGAS